MNLVQRRLMPLLPVTTDVLGPGVTTVLPTGHDEGGQVNAWPFFYNPGLMSQDSHVR